MNKFKRDHPREARVSWLQSHPYWLGFWSGVWPGLTVGYLLAHQLTTRRHISLFREHARFQNAAPLKGEP